MKQSDSPIILETARLQMRQFDIGDIDAVFAFNSSPEVQKYTGDVLFTDRAQAREVIEGISFKDYEQYGYGRWAVVYKPDQVVIGFAGLKYLPEFGETDIGYRFLPAYWGKGLASETSKAIVPYAFDTLGLGRIIGIAMPDNIGSWKVLEKVGMEFYKMDDYDGDGGHYKWYELTREQFEQKRKSLGL